MVLSSCGGHRVNKLFPTLLPISKDKRGLCGRKGCDSFFAIPLLSWRGDVGVHWGLHYPLALLTVVQKPHGITRSFLRSFYCRIIWRAWNQNLMEPKVKRIPLFVEWLSTERRWEGESVPGGTVFGDAHLSVEGRDSLSGTVGRRGNRTTGHPPWPFRLKGPSPSQRRSDATGRGGGTQDGTTLAEDLIRPLGILGRTSFSFSIYSHTPSQDTPFLPSPGFLSLLSRPLLFCPDPFS